MRRASIRSVVLLLTACAAASVPTACGSDDPANAPADAGEEDAIVVEATPDTAEAAPVDAGPPCTATPCVTQLAAGGTHTCARLADSTVRCWGSNLSGELGAGTFDDAGFDGGLRTVAVTPAVAGVTLLAAGGVGQSNDFSCALLAGGNASCWGSNRYGQLARPLDGGADLVAHPDPQQVGGVGGAIDLRGGGGHACALLDAGDVSCWGFNALDQLARSDAGTAVPTPGPAGLPMGSTVKQIATGQFHTCALLADGTVSCWGENAHGQLGRSLDGALQDSHPGSVVGLSSVVQIAAGNFHSCAVIAGGLLMCWGHNDHGQTGRGPGGAVDEPSPGLVALPAGSQVSEVSAGLLHTCAVLVDGSVWCWGANQAGAIGTGDVVDAAFNPIDVPTPTQVKGLPGPAIEVRAGYLHTCALLVGGAVMCWGSNQYGELGGGSSDAAAPNTLPHPTPSPVSL